ncbi:ABC transporter substrate-binding protein [Aneurinibacillus aneurinilyticus]|uniref:ABC transporter substrate-binding protein n=1 Tax=Aneurinibacillus aneurinilyticus TaxID=1391 RepID=UPI0023F1FFD8|nr:ABC transporter substrate-binding protein [Aneurinibacillus aneurinilyticus]MED0672233.1 ABC transporter substrate-binding protein [Aneurinibacillus aneurinilyticus]
MRKYSRFICTFCIIMLLSGCSIFHEEHTAVHIGILAAGDARLEKVAGMKKGLNDLGLDTPNVVFSIYNAKNDIAELKKQAKYLIGQGPTIVVGTGVAEGLAIAEAMGPETRRPVVLIGVTSPGVSDIQSVYQAKDIPVTGVENGYIELTAKRMELLHLLFPDRKRFVVLYDPDVKASKLALECVEAAAAKYSYSFEAVSIGRDADIKQFSLRHFTEQEAILTLPSHYIESKNQVIQQICLQKRVPIMGLNETEVKKGYTASYGLSYESQGYQASRLVLRMLHEKSGKSVPFELPDTVSLKINVAAAEKAGLSFSKIGLSYGEDVFAGGE